MRPGTGQRDQSKRQPWSKKGDRDWTTSSLFPETTSAFNARTFFPLVWFAIFVIGALLKFDMEVLGRSSWEWTSVATLNALYNTWLPFTWSPGARDRSCAEQVTRLISTDIGYG